MRGVDIGKVMSLEALPGISVLIKAMGEFSLHQQTRNYGWYTEDTPGRQMSVSREDPQQDPSILAQALSAGSVLASLERESGLQTH